MKYLIRLYNDYIGIRFIPVRMNNGQRKGYWSLIARHPKKSITWLWGIYYDNKKPWYKRIYLCTQKAMWQ